MNKYQVAIYKPVADITVCYVEIEAETESDAHEAALNMDHEDLDFQWLCCSDSLEETTAEVKGIVKASV